MSKNSLVLIDNFDSFTYNIVQALLVLGVEVVIVQSHHTSLNEILKLNSTHLIVGPGPGSPEDCLVSIQCIQELAGKIPILGICLGHQAIAAAFGGIIRRGSYPMHGKVSSITHDNSPLFSNIPTPFLATRYHSLVVDEKSVPKDLIITARSENGEIMGLMHRHFPLYGVQFHPESIASRFGSTLFSNFLTKSLLK